MVQGVPWYVMCTLVSNVYRSVNYVLHTNAYFMFTVGLGLTVRLPILLLYNTIGGLNLTKN